MCMVSSAAEKSAIEVLSRWRALPVNQLRYWDESNTPSTEIGTVESSTPRRNMHELRLQVQREYQHMSVMDLAEEALIVKDPNTKSMLAHLAWEMLQQSFPFHTSSNASTNSMTDSYGTNKNTNTDTNTNSEGSFHTTSECHNIENGIANPLNNETVHLSSLVCRDSSKAMPSTPGRPDKPELVSPRSIPPPRPAQRQNNSNSKSNTSEEDDSSLPLSAYLMHSVCHIEFNAVNMVRM